MLVKVEPGSQDFIPGSAGASTQTLTNAGPRLIVHGASALTFDGLWVRSASPRRGSIIVTPTYDPVLSRVRISAIGLFPAVSALIERSTDLIRWTTVRGGEAATVVGDTVSLDDYEFAPNVANYYRVSVPVITDTFTRNVVNGWGTTDTGQPWSVAGGTVANFGVDGSRGTHTATARNVTYKSSLNTIAADVDVAFKVVNSVVPTGSTFFCFLDFRQVTDDTLYRLQYTFTTSDTVTVTLQKVVAGAGTNLSSTMTIAGATSTTPLSFRAQANGSSIRMKAWIAASAEPASWLADVVDTAVTAPGSVRLGFAATTSTTNPLPVVLAYDNFTVDAFAIEAGPTANFGIASITPTLAVVWLKSVARPFLNLTVRLLGNTFSVDRASRGGTFPIVGRSLPVAVTDVRGPRQYTLKARTDIDPEAEDLELILASGDVLYLQAPTGLVVPAGGVFLQVGRVTVENPAPPGTLRFTAFEVTEVAAPGPDVVGATSSWQTVLSTYSTWADVMAANATWADLLELVGDPSEVIVP